MVLGVSAILMIVLWGGLMISDRCPLIRAFVYLLAHAAIYASVFVYRIDNHNVWYAVAVIGITIIAVVWRILHDKLWSSLCTWCTISTLVLGLCVWFFYAVLPSAVSVVNLTH